LAWLPPNSWDGITMRVKFRIGLGMRLGAVDEVGAIGCARAPQPPHYCRPRQKFNLSTKHFPESMDSLKGPVFYPHLLYEPRIIFRTR
jgi:hypothetical protein